MSDNMRDVLAREAAEAEARAQAEERGDVPPTPGQRGRKPAMDPSQVYSVRIPVSKLRRLRELAERRGIQPTVLIRQWVIEQLDEIDSDAVVGSDADGSETPGDRGLKLGYRRQRTIVRSSESCGLQGRQHA